MLRDKDVIDRESIEVRTLLFNLGSMDYSENWKFMLRLDRCLSLGIDLSLILRILTIRLYGEDMEINETALLIRSLNVFTT